MKYKNVLLYFGMSFLFSGAHHLNSVLITQQDVQLEGLSNNACSNIVLFLQPRQALDCRLQGRDPSYSSLVHHPNAPFRQLLKNKLSAPPHGPVMLTVIGITCGVIYKISGVLWRARKIGSIRRSSGHGKHPLWEGGRIVSDQSEMKVGCREIELFALC
jgi:hypothetical protein